jgi:iron(III) transport system ATP-binding protein
MSATIRIEHLAKRYGSTVAVHDLNLEVAPGEVVGLLGPSGCGKTTVLKCLAGLEQPSGGEIAIRDRVVASPRHSVPPEARMIGMVFQSYALWPHKTVYQNVSYPLEVRHVDRRQVPDRVRQALDLVGLADYGQRYPSELSGGQQQRVALARSIVYEPTILLFDEPLSNLDANTRARVRDELKRLLRRLGTTSVYVTHDQVEAMALCDRVVLMNGGRVVQVGAPEDLYKRPASVFVADFLGAGNVLRGRLVAPGEVEAGGLRVCCRAPGAAKLGDGVALVFRREALSLRREGSAASTNCWPMQVRDRTAFGAFYEYRVVAGSADLVLQSADSGWEVGSAGYLVIPPDEVIAFTDEEV